MGIKETIKSMYKALEKICHDLKKSEKGNKTASQRVRTATIKFAKLAKLYRKESVHDGRKSKKKKPSKKAKKSTKKPVKRKTAKRKTTKRKKRR